MEENAEKLIHDDWVNVTYADLNCTSVPLIEIVSMLDIHRSAEEAVSCLDKLKSMFRPGEISE